MIQPFYKLIKMTTNSLRILLLSSVLYKPCLKSLCKKRPNTDQKKLRIWTIFTQRIVQNISEKYKD